MDGVSRMATFEMPLSGPSPRLSSWPPVPPAVASSTRPRHCLQRLCRGKAAPDLDSVFAVLDRLPEPSTTFQVSLRRSAVRAAKGASQGRESTTLGAYVDLVSRGGSGRNLAFDALLALGGSATLSDIAHHAQSERPLTRQRIGSLLAQLVEKGWVDPPPHGRYRRPFTIRAFRKGGFGDLSRSDEITFGADYASSGTPEQAALRSLGGAARLVAIAKAVGVNRRTAARNMRTDPGINAPPEGSRGKLWRLREL